MEKYQFPKGYTLQRGTKLKEQKPIWLSTSKGCSKILIPGTEPSSARTVLGTHLFRCIPLHYLQAEVAW